MDNYRIESKIGQGAHGIVWKAVDKRSGREVALKKITSKRTTEEIPLNVMREIMCLRLVDHRYVVELLDFFPHSINYVLVFDLMPSELSEIIHDADYILSEAQVKSYMLMLLKGIAHIHKSHIMHRDLKPANLLIDKNGILKIADFGLGRLYYRDPEIAYSHQVATRWYRSPELLYSAVHYDEGVDIWAVGCIFAEMINRSPLFPGNTDIEQLSIVHRNLGTPTEELWPGMSRLPDIHKISFPHSDGVPFSKLLPNSSPDIVELINRMVCYNSAKRPPAKESICNEYFYKSPMPCPQCELPRPNTDHRRKSSVRSEYNAKLAVTDMFGDMAKMVSYSETFPTERLSLNVAALFEDRI